MEKKERKEREIIFINLKGNHYPPQVTHVTLLGQHVGQPHATFHGKPPGVLLWFRAPEP